jgi:glycosyltransferase involved in cell wall biosynthesis
LRKPLVSVVIPAYNAAGCIARAVDSVLAQTYERREILVVDDGSTDDTVQTLATYGDALRMISQANGGAGRARNQGVQASVGEFIAFLDADDRWLPDKLARQVEILEANPDIGFCSTRTLAETPDGRPLGAWTCPMVEQTMLHALFLNPGAIPGCASGVMVRRRLFDEVGLFDEHLRQEDTDLWFRLAAATGYRCIDEPLTVIVKHPDSRSRQLEAMRAAALAILRKYRSRLPERDQGGFWQAAYAGVLADYAKWEYREGQRARAMGHLLEGLVRAPRRRGRLLLGLLWAMARGQRL